jgi:hypothetical protein
MSTPRPSDLGLRRQVAVPLARAILAIARASFTSESAERMARRLWPRDEDTPRIITRTATAPATLTTTGWSPELGQNVVSDLMVALGPASAGSELLRRSTVLSLERYASVSVPALVASATNASFIGEGQAIPIKVLDTSKSVKLSPRKFATGFSLSREIVASSNAEALVSMVMRNSVALSLDSALFSSIAGDAVRPPGLLAGIAPLAATPGGGSNAFVGDIGALAAAVAPIGALDLIFIASPAEAVKILLTAGPKFNFPVLATGALTKSVICIAPIAVVAAASDAPEIQESSYATEHFESTSPTDITGGTPSPAVPVRSMFQTDSSAFRLIMDCDWGLLNSGGAAWVQNVTW